MSLAEWLTAAAFHLLRASYPQATTVPSERMARAVRFLGVGIGAPGHFSSVITCRAEAILFRSLIGDHANPDPWVPKSMAATTFAFFNLAHPPKYAFYG